MMLNDSTPPSDSHPKRIGIGGIYVSEALFKEIMEAKRDDMPMTYLSAIAELKQPDAKRLICGLGESDPTWFEAIPGLKPSKSETDPTVGSDSSGTP